MVTPTKPLPFFRDSEGTPVDRADRFGLSLKQGWEQPPKGQTLTLFQPDLNLPNVPKSLPFPSDGDLRWRPFVSGPNKKYVPLLRLRDDTGKELGDAVAYGEPNAGGRVLSVWFRLLEDPDADVLLHDVFAVAAGQN